MHFAQGRWRFVIIFPRLGLVLKLPRFYWHTAWRNFWHMATTLSRRKVFWAYIKLEVLPLIIGGLGPNLSEFWFYLKTRHPILLPTYFSFFGLLNIQSAQGRTPNQGPREFSRRNYDIIESEWPDHRRQKDQHHFIDPENFAIVNGKLRVRDYGGRGIQQAIMMAGKVLMEQYSDSPESEKI